MDNFGDRLTRAIQEKASRVVVGIDPVPDRFPQVLTARACDRYGSGRRAVASAIDEFGRMIVDSVRDVAVAVKFQVAFYEQWGVPGWAALASGIRYARRAGLLVIIDAKRGDIGSVAQAYAGAFLGGAFAYGRHYAPPFPADALTVNPFLGKDAVAPLVEMASATGRGLFILVKTSNPGSADLQDRELAGGDTVAGAAAQLVGELALPYVGKSGYSPVGAVVGATFPGAIAELRGKLPASYFLLPGYGAQGGGPAGITRAFDGQGLGAVVSSSRGVIYAYGPASVTLDEAQVKVRQAAAGFRDEVNAAIRS